MVRKPGSKHSASSSRVTARRNDWKSVRDLHQGPRSMAASRGRIHDRSPIRLPKHKKALAEWGPSIHDEREETMSKDIEELTALNRDYVASVQNGDVERFDEILAPEFYCTNPDKSLVDRAGFLKQPAQP